MLTLRIISRGMHLVATEFRTARRLGVHTRANAHHHVILSAGKWLNVDTRADHGNRFWSLPRFLRQQKWGVKWLRPGSASAPDFGHLLQSFFLTSNWVCGLTRWAVRRQTYLCYSESLRVLLPLKSTGARGQRGPNFCARGELLPSVAFFSRGNDYSRLLVSPYEFSGKLHRVRAKMSGSFGIRRLENLAFYIRCNSSLKLARNIIANYNLN